MTMFRTLVTNVRLRFAVALVCIMPSGAASGQIPDVSVMINEIGISIAKVLSGKEGDCGVGGDPLESTEFFSGAPGYGKEVITRAKRSTVRLAIGSHSDVLALLKDWAMNKEENLRLNDFGNPANYSNKIFCSGTLLRGDIVLTARHCVDPILWEGDTGLKLPRLRVNGEWRPLNKSQMASLLVADINYHGTTKDRPGNIEAAIAGKLQEVDFDQMYWRARIERLLIAGDGPTELYRDNDFAVLKLKTYNFITQRYAMSVGHLRYGPPSPRAKVAILQHPSGSTMMVGIGTLEATGAHRLSYQVKTSDGSSGSGVLDSEGRLIGIHVESGCNAPPLRPGAPKAAKGVPIAKAQIALDRVLQRIRRLDAKVSYFPYRPMTRNQFAHRPLRRQVQANRSYVDGD